MAELPEFQYEDITLYHGRRALDQLFKYNLHPPYPPRYTLTCSEGMDGYAVNRYIISDFYPPAYGEFIQAGLDYETYRVPTLDSVRSYYEGILGSELISGNLNIEVSNFFAYYTCKPLRYKIRDVTDCRCCSCAPAVSYYYSWENCFTYRDPVSGSWVCELKRTKPSLECRGSCNEGEAFLDVDLYNFSLTLLDEKHNVEYAKIKKNGCLDTFCSQWYIHTDETAHTGPTKDVTIREHRFRPFLIKPGIKTGGSKACCCSSSCKELAINEDTWKFEGNFDKNGVCTSDICVLIPKDGVVPAGAYYLGYTTGLFSEIHNAIPINGLGDYYEFRVSYAGVGMRVGSGFGKLDLNVSDLIISDPLFLLSDKFDAPPFFLRPRTAFLIGPATSLIRSTSPYFSFQTTVFTEANKFPHMEGGTLVSEYVGPASTDISPNIHLPDNIVEKLLVVGNTAVYIDHDIGNVPLRQIIVFRNTGRPTSLLVLPVDDNDRPIGVEFFEYTSYPPATCSKYVYWNSINPYFINKKLNTLKIDYNDTFPDFPEKDLFPVQIPGEIVPFMRSFSIRNIPKFTFGMIGANTMYKTYTMYETQADIPIKDQFTSEPLPDTFGPFDGFESKIISIPVVIDIPNVDFDPIPKHLAYIDGVAFRKYE